MTVLRAVLTSVLRAIPISVLRAVPVTVLHAVCLSLLFHSIVPWICIGNFEGMPWVSSLTPYSANAIPVTNNAATQ